MCGNPESHGSQKHCVYFIVIGLRQFINFISRVFKLIFCHFHILLIWLIGWIWWLLTTKIKLVKIWKNHNIYTKFFHGCMSRAEARFNLIFLQNCGSWFSRCYSMWRNEKYGFSLFKFYCSKLSKDMYNFEHWTLNHANLQRGKAISSQKYLLSFQFIYLKLLNLNKPWSL